MLTTCLLTAIRKSIAGQVNNAALALRQAELILCHKSTHKLKKLQVQEVWISFTQSLYCIISYYCISYPILSYHITSYVNN